MEKNGLCFVISPIGESGSVIRINADDLLDLIIRPALEIYGFDIIRGDHRSEANQIDVDVIKCVQDAELCICDISLPNANVYYELGRRDETGRPVILLRDRKAEDIPVDIAARRYIEYDLDSRSGIRDAVKQIRNFVEPLIEKGFDDSKRAATLGELSEVLQRVERKVDRITKDLQNTAASPIPVRMDDANDDDGDPMDAFKLSLIHRNIPLGERAMAQLKLRFEKLKWLDLIVEQVAAMGSETAGELLISNAQEFFDSDMSFKKKTEYLACLVSYANRSDREAELREMIEELCRQLDTESQSAPDVETQDLASIPNQLNRLYYGIYVSTGDESFLQMAITQLLKAYSISHTRSICYNLALCYYKVPDYNNASVYINECLAIDEELKDEDTDHLELACRIYYFLNDPRYEDSMERLARVSRAKAELLQRDLKRGRR